MSLPTYAKVRERIENVQKDEIKNLLKAVYLLAVARPVELLSAAVSGQKRVYGIRGTDVTIEKIEPPPLSLKQTLRLLSQLENHNVKVSELKRRLTKKIDVAVFKIPLSRQKDNLGKEFYREVAVPVPLKLEPWTKDLLKCFEKAGDDFVFPKNRQYYGYYVTEKQVFQDLTAIIDEYLLVEHNISGKESKKIKPHERDIILGNLFKFRGAELQEEYGFDEYDWSAYTGTQIRIANKRIVQMDWHRYINKLCQNTFSATELDSYF